MRYKEIDAQYKIDIISFLRNYLGVNVNGLEHKKLTHSDILGFGLDRVPYQFVYENPQLVANGDYLIVYDCKKEIIVYKNPLVIENVITGGVDGKLEDRTVKLPNLRGLSKDELLSLRRKTRKAQEYRKASEITKQIKKVKREEPKGYKREKRELRNRELEEDEIYEEYKRR